MVDAPVLPTVWPCPPEFTITRRYVSEPTGTRIEPLWAPVMVLPDRGLARVRSKSPCQGQAAQHHALTRSEPLIAKVVWVF